MALFKLNRHPHFEAPTEKTPAGGTPPAPNVEEITAQIREELETEYAGLKTNRDAILEEKRGLKEQLDALAGQLEGVGGAEGLKSLQGLRERLEKDELGKLISEGKHDEWFDKRTAALRGQHEKAIDALNGKLKEYEDRATAAENARIDLMLQTEVQAAGVKAGLVDTAFDDAIRLARTVFSLSPEHDALVQMDENGAAVLGPDGKTPFSIENWLESQKEHSRHWFPASKGAGAAGAGGKGAKDVDISKMGHAEYLKWRADQGLGGNQSHIPG